MERNRRKESLLLYCWGLYALHVSHWLTEILMLPGHLAVLSHTYTLTLTHTLVQTTTLSLSLTLTHTHTHTHTHTLTYTLSIPRSPYPAGTKETVTWLSESQYSDEQWPSRSWILPIRLSSGPLFQLPFSAVNHKAV